MNRDDRRTIVGWPSSSPMPEDDDSMPVKLPEHPRITDKYSTTQADDEEQAPPPKPRQTPKFFRYVPVASKSSVSRPGVKAGELVDDKQNVVDHSRHEQILQRKNTASVVLRSPPAKPKPTPPVVKPVTPAPQAKPKSQRGQAIKAFLAENFNIYVLTPWIIVISCLGWIIYDEWVLYQRWQEYQTALAASKDSSQANQLPQELQPQAQVSQNKQAVHQDKDLLVEKIVASPVVWVQDDRQKLAQPLGKVASLQKAALVVVQLWSPGCTACIEDWPKLRQISQSSQPYQGQGKLLIVPLMVNDARDPLLAKTEFAPLLPAEAVFLVDSSQPSSIHKLAKQHKSIAPTDELPITLVWDCRNHLRWIHAGSLAQASESLSSVLESGFTDISKAPCRDLSKEK